MKKFNAKKKQKTAEIVIGGEIQEIAYSANAVLILEEKLGRKVTKMEEFAGDARFMLELIRLGLEFEDEDAGMTLDEFSEYFSDYQELINAYKEAIGLFIGVGKLD